MPHTSKLTAIVLKKQILKESDLFITLFTAEQGKIKAIAHGAKSITSRRLATLQSGNLCIVNTVQSHGTLNIKDASLVSAFYSVKQNLLAFKYITDILFIIDRLLPDNSAEQQIFALYIKTLTAFGKCTKELELREYFAEFCNQIMLTLGYIGEQNLELYQIVKKIEEVIAEKLPA